MKQTPAQSGLSLICCGRQGFDTYPSLAEGIARGRLFLHQITGRDFAFDIKSWFDHLAENKMYDVHGRSKPGNYPGIVLTALENQNWIRAVDDAESNMLFETLRDDYQLRATAIKNGELRWAGKSRCCPKCNSTFTSIKDRGQCTSCGHIFLASNPNGDPNWWRNNAG